MVVFYWGLNNCKKMLNGCENSDYLTYNHESIKRYVVKKNIEDTLQLGKK